MKPSVLRLRGFTLVELMAAMAVLTLLMLGLVAMLDQAMRGWQSAQRGMDARREVRAALQMLESDLRGMVVATGRPVFISLDPELQSSRLTFLTLLRTNAQMSNNLGDLCAVQYFIDTNSAGSYRLYRRLGSSQAVYTNLAAQPNLTSADALLGANPVTEELAANVVYFRAELKRWDTNNNLTGADPSGNSSAWQTKPELVQLELTAYSQQKAQAFKTAPEWTDTNNIQKFGTTYLWRVVP